MPGKNKKRRLTISDRMTIQGMLELRRPLSEISIRVGCARSTVSREIEKNSAVIPGGTDFRCSKRESLPVFNACNKRLCCKLEQTVYKYDSAQHSSMERMSMARQVPKLPASSISEISDILAYGVDRGQSLHHIYVANPNLRSLCSEQTIRRLCYSRRLKAKPHELRRYVVYRHSYERPL